MMFFSSAAAFSSSFSYSSRGFLRVFAHNSENSMDNSEHFEGFTRHAWTPKVRELPRKCSMYRVWLKCIKTESQGFP